MNSGASLLNDRGVLKIGGADATEFLHRILTNNMLDIPPGEARYTGFLTAQGKLMFDFFVVPVPEGAEAGYFIDCTKTQASDLAKRLNFQKLRAKVVVEDVSGTLAVAAVWGRKISDLAAGLAYRDPRDPKLGFRVIATPEALRAVVDADEAAFEAHRIALGVPKGGVDFTYGDAFVHDADLDYFHGVDFKKGCYVGQEVVARVHFRKSARKRVVKVSFDGAAPESGTEVMAGDASLGRIGSVAGSAGLAMLRLDRLEEAKAAGIAITAGDAKVQVTVPPEFVASAALEKATL